jgi:hypothetical protein
MNLNELGNDGVGMDTNRQWLSWNEENSRRDAERAEECNDEFPLSTENIEEPRDNRRLPAPPITGFDSFLLFVV